jgi:hypothetical protein
MYLKVKFKCINTDITEGPDPQEWVTLKAEGGDGSPTGTIDLQITNESEQGRFKINEEYLINISAVGDEAPEAPAPKTEPPDVSA